MLVLSLAILLAICIQKIKLILILKIKKYVSFCIAVLNLECNLYT